MAEVNLTKKEIYDLNKNRDEEKRSRVDKTKRVRRALMWGGFAVVIVLGVFGLSKLAVRPTDDGGQQALILDAVSASDWVKGNNQAKAVLIEYGDFQCPACKAYHPLVDKLLKDHNDILQFAYRHFPLPQHQNAKPAANAAEAAGKQGKFWEMYDLVYQNQDKWSSDRNAEDTFLQYAESLGLNLDQFKNDRDSQAIKDEVENDYDSGKTNNINSTPTFYLNGKKIQPRSYEEFETLIKEAAASTP